MRTERLWTRPRNSIINGLENRYGILRFKMILRLNMVLRFTYTGYDDAIYSMQRLPGRFDSQNRSFLDRHIAYVLRNPLFKLQAKEICRGHLLISCPSPFFSRGLDTPTLATGKKRTIPTAVHTKKVVSAPSRNLQPTDKYIPT